MAIGRNIQDGHREQRRRTTLSDVAMRAGVSAVTVSRALRKPEMVTPTLRLRIDRAVLELGYIPNQLASALASSRTSTIGVVIPSLTNGVFADYLKALHDVLLPAGFQLLVLNSRYGPEEEEKAIATLLGQHPEAMIIAGIDQTPRSRLLLEQCGVPVIQTMELTDVPVDINIGMSHYQAGYAATRYLIGCGCRKIGNISARLDTRSRRRIDGYRAAMREIGIDDASYIATTPRASTVALGAELFRQLLERAPGLEAVFCCNDDLALGTLFECQRRGIAVPDQVSIVGFNDLEFCSSAFPALTSVATPRYEMALKSAEIVLEIIRGSGERPKELRIDLGFTLVERGSTRRAESIGARRSA